MDVRLLAAVEREFVRKRLAQVEGWAGAVGAPQAVMAWRIATVEDAPVALVNASGEGIFMPGARVRTCGPATWVWPDERAILAWAEPRARRPDGVCRIPLSDGIVMLDATLFKALQAQREQLEIERWAPREEWYTTLELDDYERRMWTSFRAHAARTVPDVPGGQLDAWADEIVLRYRTELAALGAATEVR